ncbi:LytR C-terminal domain-containing protein [Streptomyces sp. NPDC046197]|uniref:LytR C-terminal domain-containing protein n=1 Tax=Streptomyces sp. NPDC046197 TaxID=3154337 RepID=UPI0033CA57AB
MGGQYRITGNRYPRMRRPRRRGRLVFLAVSSVAVLGVIGWGTLQLIDVFTGGGKKAAAAGTEGNCPTKAGTKASPVPTGAVQALPKPGQITVNVFNATSRGGLAKQTADELKKRGFHIGQVGNASKDYDKKVKGTGLLLGPASSLNTSLSVLSTQLTGAERRADARKGGDVDLIIGTGFKQLTGRPDADKALAALNAPQPSPTTKKDC